MSGKDFDVFIRIPNEHFNSYFRKLAPTSAEANRKSHPLGYALPKIEKSRKAQVPSPPPEKRDKK